MSLNGSGVYVVNSAGQPVAANTLITAAAFNAFTADIGIALSSAVFKDGQQTITANLPMGGFRLTGLGVGSSAGHSLRYEQLFTTGTVTLLGALTLPGDSTESRANVGGDVLSTIANTDNTSGASRARQALSVAGSSGGDAVTYYTVSGVTEWSAGLDNSDSDAYVIAGSSILGTGNALRIAPTTFLATLSGAGITNIVGDNQGLTVRDSGSTVSGVFFKGASTINIGAVTNHDMAFFANNAEVARCGVGGSFKWGTGTATFGQVVKRKTADETVNASTVLQNDDHLFFSIAANEEWVATFDITAAGLLTTYGLKLAVTVPAAATLDLTGFDSGCGAAAATAHTTTSGTALQFTAGNHLAAEAYIRVTVWVLNGANAGTVQLQWAQDTSSGTGLTFRKGSQMSATRVA